MRLKGIWLIPVVLGASALTGTVSIAEDAGEVSGPPSLLSLPLCPGSPTRTERQEPHRYVGVPDGFQYTEYHPEAVEFEVRNTTLQDALASINVKPALPTRVPVWASCHVVDKVFWSEPAVTSSSLVVSIFAGAYGETPQAEFAAYPMPPASTWLGETVRSDLASLDRPPYTPAGFDRIPGRQGWFQLPTSTADSAALGWWKDWTYYELRGPMTLPEALLIADSLSPGATG